MARPVLWDDLVRREFSDGRMIRHGDLLDFGVPKCVIGGLVERGVLSKESRGLYILSEWSAADPYHVLAKRYGGLPEEPRGIICLQAAAVLHELTDMGSYNVDKLEIALAFGMTNKVASDLKARIVQWKHPYSSDDLEWRMFGLSGIHVTTPARTVCDLYAPSKKPLPEGVAREALGRLMSLDFRQAGQAVKRAGELGWGKDISKDFESMRVMYRFSEASEDERLSMGSVRL